MFDGLFVWSSYGTGMGGTIGMREARCCRHYLGSHALHIRVVGVGASWRCFQSYIIPFTPSSLCIFLSPLPDSPLVTLARTWRPSRVFWHHLASTLALSKTHWCVYSAPSPLGSRSQQVYFAEIGCDWRYSRDRPKGFDIRMEWICGLFVPLFEVIRLADA